MRDSNTIPEPALVAGRPAPSSLRSVDVGGVRIGLGEPVIIAGLLLYALFYASLAFVTSFPVLLVMAVVSGFGEALVLPALSRFQAGVIGPD